ncbi:MAG: SAM-dependent methyltransferase [Alphaproteobacteria bacterium]|nr:SAM-dependent methyltransferase [Alphaproteobacteria bacterium]
MKADRPSQTALAVCFMRATDQLVPADRRVLDDHLARSFLTPPYRALLRAMGAGGSQRLRRASMQLLGPSLGGLTGFAIIRHRYIDDALLAACDEGIDQLVILGAGYDSRALRLADRLAGVRVFEVDHPATGGRKRAIVEGHGWNGADVTRVAVDFERDDVRSVLIGAGLTPGARTFWIWEGVSMYLQRPALRATFELIRTTSAPGSRLAMDFWFLVDEASWRGTWWRTAPSLLHVLGEPVTFSMHPEDVPAFLASAGFDTVDVAPPDELARRYVRDDRRVYPCAYTVTAAVRGS